MRKWFQWEKLGAKLGVGVCLFGFVMIFFGWNGAASVDRVTAQFPYLISGGLVGLGLVVLGAALIVVETSRDERTRLRTEIENLRAAIEQLGAPAAKPQAAKAEAPAGAGAFVAGQWTYHLPSCRLLEGRGELERVTLADVAERSLAACRVCEPSVQASRPRATRRPQGRRARR